MKLVIAEKPSVGRDIARVLGCRENGDGFIKGAEYIVSWAVGHLVTLVEPDELDDKYKKWRIEDLPILPETIPTKVISKTRSQFSVLKKLMLDPSVDEIICATDAGREGELIFRFIYEKAGCKKDVSRLWISSMTDQAIREGFDKIKPSSAYNGLYESALDRAVADWLIGMNASRAFTVKYNALLSIGRVQTPTLALLVKRYHEINSFVPQVFYTVTADFGDYTGVWFDEKCDEEKTATHISDPDMAKQIVEKVKGKRATVRSVQSEEKKDFAPQLFDLTTLQREANKCFAFTAEKTLKLTQELYEKWKAVTYPRTDSKYLPMDMKSRTKETLLKLPEIYRGFVNGIPFKAGELPFSYRTFDDSKVTDHHAIIPTPQTCPLDKLPEDAKRIFDLIARRTIAAFYPPFIYEAQKVITDCEANAFRSTGKIVKDQGWKAVYNSVSDNAAQAQRKKSRSQTEQDEKMLPALNENDERMVKTATFKKDTTKPPLPHTDASILSAMENAGRTLEDETLREQMKGSGLGTPATRAAIIERLIQVGYASRKGKTLNATEKGVQLIDIVPQELSSAELTGRWELALSRIASGTGDHKRFMEGIRNMTRYIVDLAMKTDNQTAFAPDTGRKSRRSAVKVIENAKCPFCGKGITENLKAFGCADWKNGCRFTLWKDCLTRGGGPVLTEKIVSLLLQKKTLSGSTGTITITDRDISFTANGSNSPSVTSPLRYVKK